MDLKSNILNYKINFKDGIYYQLENISEGNEEILTFPNLSLYEGYIFIKTFLAYIRGI